jgi:hypothetical protein
MCCALSGLRRGGLSGTPARRIRTMLDAGSFSRNRMVRSECRIQNDVHMARQRSSERHRVVIFPK